MLPITPNGFRRYVRYNATRKGLLGGSKLWLSVYAAGRLRSFAGKLTKSGEAPLVYSGDLNSGHWTEVVHEQPRPSRSAVKTGRKASQRAERAARRAEQSPTRRNVRKAVRSQLRATSANHDLGAQRSPVAPLRLDTTQLNRGQRRRLRKAGIGPLNLLEKLHRRAIREYP